MPTANEAAWEKYLTVTGLQLDGRRFEIKADHLKKVSEREPRLLAKIDDYEQLPGIFRRNGYALLAITNGSYLLFRGNIFANVSHCGTQATLQAQTDFPLLTAGRGAGEAEYLDNAFNTGLLGHFVQDEKLYLTIRGRERSRAFEFKIAGNDQPVAVDGVQIEVDAGYEGERNIILVEAKIGARTNFNIRQLYYPYRHFRLLAPQKRVRSLLFEYDLSQATYTFREFEFTEEAVFNSVQQIRCCVYALTRPVALRVDDLLDTRLETPSQVVPQADDLNKIFELLTVINSGQNTVETISDYFIFDRRQSNYYGEAAEYLGLITRRRGVFDLTERGFIFVQTPPTAQQRLMAQLIVNSWVFRQLVRRARHKRYFTAQDVDEVIASATRDGERQHYTSSTIQRRRQTIWAWARWLAEQMKCFEIDVDRVKLV